MLTGVFTITELILRVWVPFVTDLPWNQKIKPLMLAPMQGLTNRALRSLFIEWVAPDVVFTEFMRVRPGSNRALSTTDTKELLCHAGEVPLIAQLIGRNNEALVAASSAAQDAGVVHININMGCPYGRMTGRSAGGALLKDPKSIVPMLKILRKKVNGSLSVKIRAGYDDPRQIFSLLEPITDTGVDFLILHPRTVVQKFTGFADHLITAEVNEKTSLPIIANGDICSVEQADKILKSTEAAGLMLGRGAIADPLLFERVRGKVPSVYNRKERLEQLQRYLLKLLDRYKQIFSGDDQVLRKLKEVVNYIRDTELEKEMRCLKRCKKLSLFEDFVKRLE